VGVLFRCLRNGEKERQKLLRNRGGATLPMKRGEKKGQKQRRIPVMMMMRFAQNITSLL
jgi:hypothetical protein